jgi:hypothetical protein
MKTQIRITDGTNGLPAIQFTAIIEPEDIPEVVRPEDDVCAELAIKDAEIDRLAKELKAARACIDSQNQTARKMKEAIDQARGVAVRLAEHIGAQPGTSNPGRFGDDMRLAAQWDKDTAAEIPF